MQRLRMGFVVRRPEEVVAAELGKCQALQRNRIARDSAGPEGRWCAVSPEEQEKQDGSPAHVKQDFIDIKFQLGPVKEVGINGCQIDDVLDVLIKRLGGFERGPFACEYNKQTLAALQQAKYWSTRRTAARTERNVEGLKG